MDQLALAKRVGVTQQTVSRWETGQSRPGSAALGRLAAALDLPVDELMRVAAMTRPTPLATAIDATPVRSLIDVLPLPGLSFSQFEQFTAALLERRFPRANVQRLGVEGDDQRGYDILVVHPDGHRLGVQCKRERQFGPKRVRDTIVEAELKVDESAIALSRLATSAARFEVDLNDKWVLWDQDDLSRQVRSLPLESALSLVDTYFVGLREPFLGHRAPGPWLTTDEYFAKSPTTLLDHRQTLAGRDAVVAAISDWASHQPLPIGVLVGRGGLGKTKVLYEVARRQTDVPVQFRFLGVGQRPTPEGFDSLPLADNLVVVIDDAHDVENVAAIATQLRHMRENAKLLLATRPSGETQIDSDIWRLNQSLPDANRWVLEDLSAGEASSLVCELTGLPAIDPRAKQLAALSADLPFFAVVAAKQWKDGSIAASSFATEPRLRRDVLSRFTEMTISNGSRSDTGERRAVLAALAAFQPVRMGDQDFQNAMTMMTGITTWDLVSGRIRELEDSGLVMRRGESVRVVPDMLGDILLGQAAFDERSQVPTKYLDRAQAAATGAPLQHLLVNSSRMDWQVRDGRPSRSDMVGALWQTLRAEFVEVEAAEQLQMVKLVEKMAFYQPDRAFDLITLALELPAELDSQPTSQLSWAIVTHQDVVAALPPVLRNIAYNLEYLDRCLDILWQLAHTDLRPPNQHPDHARRVLADLARLQTGKPLEYNHKVIDRATVWLEEPHLDGFSPFDVLEPLLATEGHAETSSDMTITFHTYGINPDSVREVRNRVVELAIREARSEDTGRAVRAIGALEHAIRYPIGPSNRVAPTAQEEERWSTEFLPIIEVLGVIGSEPEHDPAVRIAIRQALGWLVEYGDKYPSTQSAATASIARLVTSIEDDLALCLHDGWGRLAMGRRGVSYEDADSHLKFNRSTAVASEALSGFAAHGPLDWRDTGPTLREDLSAQIIECGSIDRYEILGAIAALSAIDPLAATHLMIARVDRQVDGPPGDGYDAIPYHWEPALEIRNTAHLEECLVAVRDWMAADTRDKSYHLADDGARLYKMIAGEWNQQALLVLSDFKAGTAPKAQSLVGYPTGAPTATG